MAKRFVILDGSSLIFRAYYALPPLSDSKGTPTNAILGFSNMLAKIVTSFSPACMALAFDKSRKTFRTERYAEYKGTRDKTPEELAAQFPLLREYAECFGMPFLEADRYEADDIIGTLAVQAAASGHDVVVITGDRDALQLIRPNVRVFLTKKGISHLKEYDEAAFREEYGMEPIRLIDLKGLMGDSSDNIPGIKGVGPKTALSLLQEYGTLEAVLAHTEDITRKKLRESLIAEREIALLSKELATIHLAVPGISFDEHAFLLKPSHERMESFCARYELRGVWRSFSTLFPAEQASASDVSGILKSADGTEAGSDVPAYEQADRTTLAAMQGALAIAGVFSGKAPFEGLAGLAICTEGGRSYFLGREDPLWMEFLGVLQGAARVIVSDSKPFLHAGISFSGELVDAKLLSYLLDPETGRYEPTELAARYLPQEEVPQSFAAEEARAIWEAALLQRLAPLLSDAVDAGALAALYRDVERPLVPLLSQMEQDGVYVNRDRLHEKSEEVDARIDGLRAKIHALAGHAFNINSTKQLGSVLFEELGLPARKKTKTGYSTNAETLESLRSFHPIIEHILSYRMWTKLKSTYLDGIAALVDAKFGRVHTSFNQTATATGRLSSSDPNLQNIPVRTEEGRTIRALFEPGEGYDMLLSADYSQIELRVLAHMSGDESFIDAFRRNQDIHARTAAEVFDVPLEAVTPDLRRRAKAVNFGIVYGISDFGLARDLSITRKEAGSYIERYFSRYPGVRAFMDGMVARAHETGFVRTMLGRRRALPAISSRNYTQRSLAERMAMNTPIQGTAADIIKIAMIRTARRLREERLKSRILLQVHDELVLEARSEELACLERLLREEMEHAAELSVPLVVDISSGKNWAEAK